MTARRLLPEVKKFLSGRPVKMFVGGKWVSAVGGGTFKTLDPGCGSVLATVTEGRKADVNRAVNAAQKAFKTSGWAEMPVKNRAVLLHRLADLVDKNAGILSQIESLDVGKPLAQAAEFDIPNVGVTLRWYADLSVRVRYCEPIAVSGFDAHQIRVPYGVAAFVLPWNFPLLLAGWGLSPALAAGNTCVIKPAEDTPLSTLYFCKLVKQAGIPDGVVNVVTGYGETAGAALASHPGRHRKGYTGSPEVGNLNAEACGRNLVPVKLDLGGKGAAVVFDDTNPKEAAEGLVGALTLNTGQVCCTASRWILHEKIARRFISAATKMMKGLKIGHGLDPATQMGPVVSDKQRKRVLGYLKDGQADGARVLLKGGRGRVQKCPGGFYVKPALLTGEPENVCAREEIFGPVAYIMKFKTERQAINLVNRSPYGLANSVWSADLKRANRVAEALVAGNSWINAHNLFPSGVPYAGCNLSGMGGGVLGPETLFDYLRAQSVVRPLE